MIIGKMATYPARLAELRRTIQSIVSQVDTLLVCLNQFQSVPSWIDQDPRIQATIPSDDLKDVGKFYPTQLDASYFFYLDDDIVYPPDYVRKTIHAIDRFQDRVAVGYHGSYFTPPAFGVSPRQVKAWLGYKLRHSSPEWYRETLFFSKTLLLDKQVEQLGTGVLATKGTIRPPFEYFRGSQKFVDVRFARWCYENGVRMFCLSHQENWLIDQRASNSIYEDFTWSTPSHVQREMLRYAGKVLRLRR